MTQRYGCDDRWQQLIAYERGELTREQKADLERHLEVCPACARVLVVLYAVDRGMHDGPAEAPPAELRDRILGATSRRSGIAGRVGGRSSWALPWVAGASGALTALALFAAIGPGWHAGAPVTEAPRVRPMRADAATAAPRPLPQAETELPVTVRTAFLVTHAAAPSPRIATPGRMPPAPKSASRATTTPAPRAPSVVAEPAPPRPRTSRPPTPYEAEHMLAALAGALRPLAVSRPIETQQGPTTTVTPPVSAPPQDTVAPPAAHTFRLAAAHMPADPSAGASLADLRSALRRHNEQALSYTHSPERWERGVVSVDFIRSRF